ncbi:signal peptidase I [Streptococcus equi]|uniref:Signal peptidase I n=1 Tax=Streptococcus equi subsp. zooepidemicus Sz4is TaxID=1381082 RepID=A0AAW3GJ14_STRSZ|nr:signal peptidase I [Streptococcus equi subsp. zooepidemicus Sz4is]
MEKEVVKKKQSNLLGYFLMKLMIFSVVIISMFVFVFGVHFNKGEAMYPKVRDGDVLIYYRLTSDFQLGDVILYKSGEQKVVGRIVAKEGDKIELSKDGELLVNGNIQQEEIFFPTQAMPGGITYPYTVEKNSYFILCDNREHASDSRFVGAVSKDDIKGKVVNLFRRRGI